MTAALSAPVTAALPGAPPTLSLRVVVLGALALGGALREAWRIVPLAGADDVQDGDVVLVERPDTALLRALATRRRGCVLALRPRAADSEQVVELLDGGAEVCLRGAVPLEVHAHLVAVHRRRGLTRTSQH